MPEKHRKQTPPRKVHKHPVDDAIWGSQRGGVGLSLEPKIFMVHILEIMTLNPNPNPKPNRSRTENPRARGVQWGPSARHSLADLESVHAVYTQRAKRDEEHTR